MLATSCDNRKINNALSIEDLASQLNKPKAYNGFVGAKSKHVTPLYNDFLNDVFASKTHQAYKLREKNDLKVNFIETKYG